MLATAAARDGPRPNREATKPTPRRYIIATSVTDAMRTSPKARAVHPATTSAAHPYSTSGDRRLGVAGDDVHVHVAAAADQPVEERAGERVAPARVRRLPHHDLGDVLVAGVRQDLLGGVLSREGRGLRAERLRELEVRDERVALGLRHRLARPLDVDHPPLALQ